MQSLSLFLACCIVLTNIFVGESVAAASDDAFESLGQSSRLTSLVISEVMYHPPPRADGKQLEFVELFNSLPTPEDLSGYRLSGDVDFTFPAGTVLPGRSFLVIARKPADVQSVYQLTGVLGPFNQTNNLPNGRGTIRLRHPTGAIFLELEYGNDPPWPVSADGAGHSIILARPSYGEKDPHAWEASDEIGGSPGRAEPVSHSPLRSVVINEFLAHTDDPEQDFVELYNRGNETVDISGCVLTDGAATNRFVFPSNSALAPRGFLVLNQTELGFALNSAGETVYLKDPARQRVLDAVRFGGQENGVATGRTPDGSDEWSRVRSKTPGQKNAGVLVSDVIINELMYAPISREDDDQFVEIYNRSAAQVDLSGWRLEDGIQFTFPTNTSLGSNEYLVVAKNAARLATNNPLLSPSKTFGNFEGKLAGSGERIVLTKPDLVTSTNLDGQVRTNLIHIAVDEVTYGTGGQWGQWAHEGGSSLERVDPRADGRLAANWGDSDETHKAPWTTVAFTGRLDNATAAADQLQVLLQGQGECLIDDVQVLNAQGVNQIANSAFESDASGWVSEGTEDQSRWEPFEGFQSAHSYRIVAVDRGDNEVNRVRVGLNSTLAQFTTATLQAKVRWLKGFPSVLLRLRGCSLEAIGAMNIPGNLGTPGARNSRALSNGAPAIYSVTHSPVLPSAGQPVIVTARASDPDELSSLTLMYRLDPAVSQSAVLMRDDGAGGDAFAGDGTYSALIPGQPAGTLVAFTIGAADSATPAERSVFPNDAPAHECLVRFGESIPTGTFPVYQIWMTQNTLDTWTRRSKLNNTPLPVTFVLGNDRVIYDTLALYAGSPYIAPGYNSPTGNRCGYSISFPADGRFLGDTDLVLDWPGGHGNENTALQEQMAYWIADRVGLPYSHRYTIRLQVNGVTDMQRRGVFEAVNQPAGDFVKAWSPDRPNGDFYKIERAFEFSDSGSLMTDPQPHLENYTTTGGVKKTARYRWSWVKRSTDDVNDYQNIFNLVDAANATAPEPYTSQVEALVDLEEWMGILAMEHIIVNFDAYGHEIGKNMYAYKPDGGKWQLYMFDLDWLMLAAAQHRSVYAPSTAPLFNAEDPAMVRMFGHPPFLRAYYRTVKKAVEGPLVSANCDPVMDAKYQALVANGVTLCDGQSLAAPTAVKNWFRQRRAALVTQLAAFDTPFTISGSREITTENTTFLLQGSAPIEVKSIQLNGEEYPVAWTSVTNWEVRLSLTQGRNAFDLRAVDASGRVLANYTSAVTITSNGGAESPVGKIIINEIMNRPAISGAEFVELFNRSSTSPFDLSGWRLRGLDITFPKGSILSPGGYLVVAKNRAAFVSAYGNSIPVAGEFEGNLNPEGETLSLVIPGATLAEDVMVDQVSYSASQPWPAAVAGASLQLIDPDQDNSRVSNWAVSANSSGTNAPLRWRYVTAAGTASSSRIYIYMTSPGDVYIDDLRLVAGSTPDTGSNFIGNGDFEAGSFSPWNVSPNLVESVLDRSVHHGGGASLHLISNSAGASQGTSIWQDIGPLETDAPYVLSYWYLPSTNGSALTIRLSGSGISSTQNISPTETPTLLSTPGSANSVRSTLASFPPLWINELKPNNPGGEVDNAGEHDPWVEIYNDGDSALPLDGFYLTDDYTALSKWAFPSGTSIGAKQFLVVWLDGQPEQTTSGSVHANFRAKAANGSVVLSLTREATPMVLDYQLYTSLPADRSIGLYPDGQSGTSQPFYFTTPAAPNNNATAPFPIWINEWMASNTKTLRNPVNNQFDDWFELFNPNQVPLDLTGYSLSDSLTNQTARWTIPSGTAIPAGGFLLVWADNEDTQNPTGSGVLHAGFKLDREGESIVLFGPNGKVIDFVTFGPQTNDVSEGRSPDGSMRYGVLRTPTPSGPNASEEESEIRILKVTLDPGRLTFSWPSESGQVYRIEYTSDLGAPEWIDLGEVTAQGQTASASVNVEASHRFYRVSQGATRTKTK